MERCDELAGLVRRVLETSETGDFATVRAAFLRSPHLRVIGSDAAEEFVGYDQAMAVWEQVSREMAGMPIEPGPVEAWSEGDVGWALCRPTIVLPDGHRDQARLTIVAVRTGGGWGIVQWHYSVPVPNEVTLGEDVASGIERLLQHVGDVVPSMPVAESAETAAVTIVFTDLEASVTTMEHLGEQVWMDLLHWHQALVQRLVAHHAGQVVRSLGDGFFITFTSPLDAIRCAAAIQSRVSRGWHDVPIPARIGIHVGSVIERDGDLYGRAVVVGARIAAQAAGGEILVSDEIRQLVGSDAEFGETRVEALKGLAGVHTFHQLPWQPLATSDDA